MIRIDNITKGDRTLVVVGKLTNTDDWREYLERVIRGLIDATDYVVSDRDLTRKINEQTRENIGQGVDFIVQINKP